jgi:hypothetical protein
MANDVQRTLPQIAYISAGAVSSLDLPRDSVLKSLDLMWNANITQGATPDSGVQSAQGVFAGIRRLEIVADGGLTLWSIDPLSLYVLNSLWSECYVERDSLPATATTGVYQGSLQVPFALPFSEDPNVTLLNAQALSSLQLRVTWGAVTDYYTTHVNTTLNTTSFLEPQTHEIVGLGPRSIFSAFKVGQILKDVTAASTNFQVDLPRGNVLRGLLVKTRTTATVEIAVETILNELRIESSELNRGLFTHRRIRATDTDGTGRSGYNIRNHQLRNFGLNQWTAAFAGTPAQQAMPLTGFFPVEFMEDKRVSSALRTQPFSSLQMVSNVSAPANSPRLDITTLEIIPAAAPR